MNFLSIATADDLIVRGFEEGSAAELAGAINTYLASVSPAQPIYALSVAGAGDGTRWGATLTHSATAAAPANLNFSFAGTPAVPTAPTTGSTFRAVQAGRATEASTALGDIFAGVGAGDTVICTELVGSANGAQWLAWTLQG